MFEKQAEARVAIMTGAVVRVWNELQMQKTAGGESTMGGIFSPLARGARSAAGGAERLALKEKPLGAKKVPEKAPEKTSKPVSEKAPEGKPIPKTKAPAVNPEQVGSTAMRSVLEPFFSQGGSMGKSAPFKVAPSAMPTGGSAPASLPPSIAGALSAPSAVSTAPSSLGSIGRAAEAGRGMASRTFASPLPSKALPTEGASLNEKRVSGKRNTALMGALRSLVSGQGLPGLRG